MIKNIYIDTSVFGGYFDEEFKEYSVKFFEKLMEFNCTILLSDVAIDELTDAPQRVKDLVNLIPKENIEKVFLDNNSKGLALKYIEENVVGETSLADYFHIAIATVQKADLLVSWNFKHIVNVNRIRGYNGVNLMNGYPILEIRNPREIFDYE